MICQRYGSQIYVDLNGDVLGYSVGMPFAFMLIALAIFGTIQYFKLITEATMLKINLVIIGVVGSATVISFLKWVFQTWGGFMKWIEYC